MWNGSIFPFAKACSLLHLFNFCFSFNTFFFACSHLLFIWIIVKKGYYLKKLMCPSLSTFQCNSLQQLQTTFFRTGNDCMHSKIHSHTCYVKFFFFTFTFILYAPLLKKKHPYTMPLPTFNLICTCTSISSYSNIRNYNHFMSKNDKIYQKFMPSTFTFFTPTWISVMLYSSTLHLNEDSLLRYWCYIKQDWIRMLSHIHYNKFEDYFSNWKCIRKIQLVLLKLKTHSPEYIEINIELLLWNLLL